MSIRFNRVLFYAVFISLSVHLALFAYLLWSPKNSIQVSSLSEGSRGFDGGVIEMTLEPYRSTLSSEKGLSVPVKKLVKQHSRVLPSKKHYGFGNQGTGPDATGSLKNDYAQLRQKIYKNRFYPKKAKENGYEGSVKLYFQTKSDGSVSNLKVIKSSGYVVLDDAALLAVKRSAPLNVTGQKLSFTIDYKLY